MDVDADAGDMAMDMEMDAEMEEEPGMRYDMMNEDELMEAVLSKMDIEVIEESSDKEVQLESLKKEIYAKVIQRLLKESKK